MRLYSKMSGAAQALVAPGGPYTNACWEASMSEQSTPASAPNQPQPSVEYRPAPGFPGYRVGSDGTVWSAWRRLRSRQRRGFENVIGDSWSLLAPGIDKTGRCYVHLRRNGRGYMRAIHRLVLEVFVGPRPPGMECCHFPDRNPSNNALANLRWDTHKSNVADRVIHGTENRGERNGHAKLSAEDVRLIRTAAQEGERQNRIAARFGVSEATVSMAVRRLQWRHLDET